MSNPYHTYPGNPPRYEHLFHLSQHFHILRDYSARLAATYRNLGLAFYSHEFPLHLIYDGRINPELRGWMIKQFTANAWHELPDVIHIIGTIDFVLRSAAVQFGAPESKIDVQEVLRSLAFAEMQLIEGERIVQVLEQGVELLETIRRIRVLEGTFSPGPAERRRRKVRMREAWICALPTVCWES